MSNQVLQSTADWDRLSVTYEVPANSTSNTATVRLMAVESTSVEEYDGWGKVLSMTGRMAGTLGIIQPFRYRGMSMM